METTTKQKQKPGRKTNNFNAKEYYKNYIDPRKGEKYVCEICDKEISLISKNAHLQGKKHNELLQSKASASI